MRTSLLAAALLAAAAPAPGQTAPSMTLEQALAIAEERNPAYLGARAQIDIADMDVRARWGQFVPTLSANMGWSGAWNTQTTGTDDFGQTVALPDPISFKTSSASQGFNSSYRLFDGFQNVNWLRAAQQDVASAEAGVRVQGLQVDADVTQRFYDALRAQRLIDVEEALLASAIERLDANERLFRVASVTQVEVLGAQVDVASQEQRLDRQRGEAKKARLRVLETLGVLGEMVDFEPVGSFPPAFDPGILDADALVAQAVAANPVLSQRAADVSSSRFAHRAARGSWLPTVDLNAGWGRSENARDLGAFFDVSPSRDRGYRFSMSVGWQLFNGFQRSQQIGQATARLYQAEENLRQARLQVEQQVRAALIDLQNNYEALRIQERSTTLSRTRVELAREQYRIGSIDFTSLQTIIANASNEERALVDAEYGLAVALVSLEQQAGGRVRPNGG